MKTLSGMKIGSLNLSKSSDIHVTFTSSKKKKLQIYMFGLGKPNFRRDCRIFGLGKSNFRQNVGSLVMASQTSGKYVRMFVANFQT